MYKLLKSLITGEVSGVYLIETRTSIPLNDANSDYQRYLKWLDGYEYINTQWVKTSDGNTPLPADE